MEKTKVANWYEVQELKPNLFLVNEPSHVTFFVLKNEDEALFIDSGLGLSDKAAQALLEHLKVKRVSVISTHAHCDHVGLNYLAERIWISRTEWEKYSRFHDNEQLGKYYRLNQDTMEWPPDMDQPVQRPWKPRSFSLIEKWFPLANFS